MYEVVVIISNILKIIGIGFLIAGIVGYSKNGNGGLAVGTIACIVLFWGGSYMKRHAKNYFIDKK